MLEMIILLLAFLTIFFFFFSIKFALIIIRTKESIEESLDILDENYYKISRVLEIPIFNDSPQIKEVVDSIKNIRSSILYIANIMTSAIEKEGDNDDQEED